MGKVYFFEDFDAVVAADAVGGGGPLPHSVESHEGGLVEWAWEECGCGVGLVMGAEEYFAFVVEVFGDGGAQEEFFFEPGLCIFNIFLSRSYAGNSYANNKLAI